MEKALIQPGRCGKGVFTPAAIKAGLAVCQTKVPWGYSAAAHAKTGTPGEPGDLLWQISSADHGPIYSTGETWALSAALRALNRLMRTAGITHSKKKHYVYVGRVWLY